jgi:cation transport regulator ChaC
MVEAAGVERAARLDITGDSMSTASESTIEPEPSPRIAVAAGPSGDKADSLRERIADLVADALRSGNLQAAEALMGALREASKAEPPPAGVVDIAEARARRGGGS